MNRYEAWGAFLDSFDQPGDASPDSAFFAGWDAALSNATDTEPISLVEIWALQYRLAELTAENEALKEQVQRMARANVALAKRLADVLPKEEVLR